MRQIKTKNKHEENNIFIAAYLASNALNVNGNSEA